MVLSRRYEIGAVNLFAIISLGKVQVISNTFFGRFRSKSNDIIKDDKINLKGVL